MYGLEPVDYDTQGKASRELLANALMETAKSDLERRKLTQYKENIEKLNAEDAKLKTLSTEIKEIKKRSGNPDRFYIIRHRLRCRFFF